MGVLGWVLGLLGLGRGGSPSREEEAAAAAAAAAELESFRVARRQVIAYLRAARPAIRMATETKKAWFYELGKLYELIVSSPAAAILEKAGEIGYAYQPRFRQAIATLQAIEVPPECATLHETLASWIEELEAACIALKDARRLSDQRQLGDFRDRLNSSRTRGRRATSERAGLIAQFRLTARTVARPARRGHRRAPRPAAAVARLELAPGLE